MRWGVRIGVGVGGVLLAVALAGVALLWRLDTPGLQSALQDEMQTRFQRDLDVAGPVRRVLWPRPGLELQQVALSEPGSAQGFARAERVRLELAWWPLLAGEAHLDGVWAQGVQAHVVRQADGRLNIADFLTQADVPGAGFAAWPELEIEGAELALRDAASGLALRLERANLKMTEASAGARELVLSGRMLAQAPRADATLSLRGQLWQSELAHDIGLKQFEAQLTGSLPWVRLNALTVRGALTVEREAGLLRAEDLAATFQGDVAGRLPLLGVDVKLSAPRLVLAETGQLRTVNGLTVQASGKAAGQPFTAALQAPAWGLDADGLPSGEPSSLQVALEGSAPWQADIRLGAPQAQGTAVRWGDLQVQARGLPGGGGLQLTGPLVWQPGERHWQWLSDQGRLDLDAASGTDGADGAGSPASSVPLSVALEWAGQLREGRLALQADLPEGEARIELGAGPGTPAAWLAGAVVWPRLAWPGPAVHEAGLALLSTLPPVEIGLQVELGRWRGPGGSYAYDVAGLLQMSRGQWQWRDGRARWADGTLHWQGGFDATERRLTVKGDWQGGDVAQLSQALGLRDLPLSGRGDVAFDINYVQPEGVPACRGVSGRVGFSLRDGAVGGLDVAQALRGFRTQLGREDAVHPWQPAAHTAFRHLNGALVIDEGQWGMEALAWDAPGLQLALAEAGGLDCATQGLELRLLARPVGEGDAALRLLRHVTVPVQIAGLPDARQFTLEWTAVAQTAWWHLLRNHAGDWLEQHVAAPAAHPAPGWAARWQHWLSAGGDIWRKLAPADDTAPRTAP